MDTSKLTALTALATATDDDILYIVDAPAGTATSYKITVANLRKSMVAAIIDPVLVQTNDGINFDTAAGDDADIDILTLNVTGSPKLWWDESIDAFSLTKRLFIGDTQTTNSVDPMVNVNRNVNADVAGNGHCFSDSSVITRAGDIAYNSFDGRFTVSGTANYNHFAVFQCAPTLNTSGTTLVLYGAVDAPTVSDGVVSNRYGFYAGSPTLSGDAVITNNYGFYVPEQTLAGTTLNYAIFTAGATMSQFTGHVGIGAAPSANQSLQVAGAHTLTTYYGVQNSATNNNSSVGFDAAVTTTGTGNCSLIIGAYLRMTHDSSGTNANSYGAYSGIVNNGGACTNAHGFYVADATGTGSVANQYGLHVAALTKGGTLNYAIWTEGATASLFEGPLHFKNVAAPTALTDGAVLYATDQAAGNSCIHAKTENGGVIKLYQQAHIADAAGGTEIATINAILVALENTGFLATS